MRILTPNPIPIVTDICSFGHTLEHLNDDFVQTQRKIRPVTALREAHLNCCPPELSAATSWLVVAASRQLASQRAWFIECSAAEHSFLTCHRDWDSNGLQFSVIGTSAGQVPKTMQSQLNKTC